ncbi:MAG: hypothetical protein PHW54_04155, partial [Candidatus Omnitrophica bacterium]|nr:hypothetical protein [Candidatus Omnitrophota bacterium]
CPDDTLPAVSLRFAKGDNIFSKIFNSNFHNKSRTLRVERVEPESGVCFPPGEYPCFDIEIQLHEKSLPLRRASNILSTDKMKFIFDNGRGRIYWKGQEITKKLGMYTSLRAKGRWHDSVSSAIWEVFEGPKGIIKVRGRWLHLPIVQNWHMRLINDGAIEFKAFLTVEDKFEVERMQANLMLLESYAYWLAGKEEVRFGSFKGDVDDDWDCIWAGEADGQVIGVRAGQDTPCPFPDAAISVREPFPEWALRIINSDMYHRSRVLQYASSQKRLLLPGDYPYFNGNIYIGVLPPGFK